MAESSGDLGAQVFSTAGAERVPEPALLSGAGSDVVARGAVRHGLGSVGGVVRRLLALMWRRIGTWQGELNRLGIRHDSSPVAPQLNCCRGHGADRGWVAVADNLLKPRAQPTVLHVSDRWHPIHVGRSYPETRPVIVRAAASPRVRATTPGCSRVLGWARMNVTSAKLLARCTSVTVPSTSMLP